MIRGVFGMESSGITNSESLDRKIYRISSGFPIFALGITMPNIRDVIFCIRFFFRDFGKATGYNTESRKFVIFILEISLQKATSGHDI